MNVCAVHLRVSWGWPFAFDRMFSRCHRAAVASMQSDMNLDGCTARLAANADVFAGLVRGLAPGQAGWKPAPGKWSILEVINHLADEEAEDFRARLGLTLTAPDVPWPPIDPERWVVSRGYAQRDLEQSLARFLEERTRSVAWLLGLRAPDWSLRHVEPQAGILRAGDLLAAWLDHDLLHIRQIVRLQHEFLLSDADPYGPSYSGGAWR